MSCICIGASSHRSGSKQQLNHLRLTGLGHFREQKAAPEGYNVGLAPMLQQISDASGVAG